VDSIRVSDADLHHPKKTGAETLRPALPEGRGRFPCRMLESVRSMAAKGVRATPDIKGRERTAPIIHGALAPVQENTIRCVPMRLGHAMEIDLGCKTEYPSFYTGDYDTSGIVSALRLLKADCRARRWASVGFWAVQPLRASQMGQIDLASHAGYGRFGAPPPLK
jgi:hypothetical protein